MSAPAACSAAALGGLAGEPICHSGGGRAHDCRQGAGVLPPELFGPRTCSANAKWLRGSEGPLPGAGRLSPVRHEGGEDESRQTLTCAHVHFRAQRPSARTGPPRSEERWPRAWQAEALAPLSAAALGLSGQGRARVGARVGCRGRCPPEANPQRASSVKAPCRW